MKKQTLAESNSELVKQWHPTRNGDLTPQNVAASSNRKVWWYLPYDDTITGKHFDFEWKASISNRAKGARCPYLTGNAVWPGYNDFQTLYPEVAAEWHPTKNGELTPKDVTAFSNVKVWWLLSYNDPKTGKHHEFEWEAAISSRTRESGCPYLIGKKVWPGYNDLQTRYPEIAAEWHPTKNGELNPQNITYGSKQKVWWLLPYNDSKTGKHYDFEWMATVNSRTSGQGCPYLKGNKVWPGYNDLQTRYPEIAAEWHPTKNSELTPKDVTAFSNVKVWWLLPYDDPKTGKHYDFEWMATVNHRTQERGCPYLTGNKVWPGYNDLQTRYPEIAAEWHPTKNGELNPQNITCGSKQKVWWYLPYDDPITGEHFDFEWQATVSSRVRGQKCPYVVSRRVWPGYNDLQTHYPEVAAEWHPTKNGELTSKDVMPSSMQKVWWLLPYDDPKTGKHYDFEWKTSINSRTKGEGCPYLSNKRAWPGFNDLQTFCPEIATELHPTKNRKLKTTDVTVFSSKKVWWRCNVCGHEWRAAIASRTGMGSGCPKCAGKARK